MNGGFMPLWCPYSAGGMAFFAEGQSGAAYPVNWLFYGLLPFSMAYNTSVVFHLLLLAAGTYILFRKLDFSCPAALTGTIGFALSGYFIRKLMFVNFIQGFAYLPLILICAAPDKKSGFTLNRKRCLTGGLLLGIQCLCGHPQAVIMSLIILWIFAITVPKRKSFKTQIKTVACISALGCLIGAWQLLPTAELMTRTPRYDGTGPELSGQMSLPPAYLPAFFLHDVFGNAADGTFEQSNWPAYEWELSGFQGIVIFTLACLTGFRMRRQRFFIGCVLTGLLLALGRYVPANDLLYKLPVLGSFRAPVRWSVIMIWGMCGLAACTIDQIRTRRIAATGSIRAPGVRLALLVTLLGSVFAWFLFNGVFLINPLAKSAWLDTTLFLTATVMIVIIGWYLPGKWWSYLLPLLVFSEFYHVQSSYPASGPDRLVLDPPAGYRIIRDAPATVLSLIHESSGLIRKNWHQGWSMPDRGDYSAFKDAYTMYSGMIHEFKLVSFNEWSPLHTIHYRQWGMNASKLERATIMNFDIGYVVAPPALHLFDGKSLRKMQDWELRKTKNDVSICPRIAQPEIADGSLMKIIERIRFRNDDSSVFLPGDAIPESATGWSRDARIDSRELSVNRHRLNVSASNWTCVLTGSVFDNGWRVSSVDPDVRLVSADGMFQAIIVPGGTHEIELVYEPVSYRLGFFVCALAAMTILFVAAMRGPGVIDTGCDEYNSFAGMNSRRWFVGMCILLSLILSGLIFRWNLWLETAFNWLV